MNFQKFGILTIIAVYLLIFVGGVVRSTGSGMGCPDWPKCFGSYIPPTKVEELPLNYREIYGAKLKGDVIFNPVKTWIEYLNRLLGALIGILVFSTFLYSIKYWRSNKLIVVWSAIAVLLTGIQGWIGAKVVATELATYMVSIHMLIAIIIVGILIYVLFRSRYSEKLNFDENLAFKPHFIPILFLITLIQVLLGTQVREAIDTVAKVIGEEGRATWIGNVGVNFFIHRSFSLVVLGAHLFMFLYIRKFYSINSFVFILNKYLIYVVLLEIFTGIFLNYFGFPALIQPFHLTIAIIALGLQLMIIFSVNPKLFIKI